MQTATTLQIIAIAPAPEWHQITSHRVASDRTGPFVPDFQHELVANRMGSRSAETEDYLKDPDSKNKPTRTNTRILPRIRMEFLIAQIGNE
eukprot:jgi/Psemu1/307525/fgenesh1_kg.336_\